MTRAGIGAARVGRTLGLIPRQVRLAARTGLLPQHDDGTFDCDAVARAAAQPDTFLDALRREEPLNATEAAARLGVSRSTFQRVARAAQIPVVDRVHVHRYGRTLDVRYWRTADIDGLAPHLVADRELRAAATAVARSDAARKAARTRARNREQAAVARIRLDARRPAADAGPVDHVVWAAALAQAHGTTPGWLQRFAGDVIVRDLAELLRTCRLTPDTLRREQTAAQPAAQEAVRALAGPRESATLLGAPAEDAAHHLPSVAAHMPRDLVLRAAATPPHWLLELYAHHAFTQASEDLARALDDEWYEQQLAGEAVCRAAAEAVATLTDDAVADLFALPADLVRELRPRSGRWAAAYVAELLGTRPLWLRSVPLARAEAERRAAGRRTRRRARRTSDS